MTTTKSPRLPVQDPQFWRRFSIAEKYFYIVLCHLLKKYGNEQGKVVGHDKITQNGIPSFQSFHISQRICKSARKKLQEGNLISFRHVYGDKGHRIGTEYALCEAAYREDPKDVHARIFSRVANELSPCTEISPSLRLISP